MKSWHSLNFSLREEGPGIMWSLLGPVDVSLDVGRHTHGPQKDKGKAGAQRQIKKGQREKGALTSAAPLTLINGNGISIYLSIHLTLLFNSQREKMLFLVTAISKEG